MILYREIRALLIKDFLLEWRNKYALNGILLYVISTIFVCYISFQVKAGHVDVDTWNTLFWIILLFTAVNSIVKSFIIEPPSRFFYYYQVASPQAVIISKIIYNIALMAIVSALALFVYSIVMGNPVGNFQLFFITILAGAISLSVGLSLISGISSKSNNASTLMVILGFPVVMPILMIMIRLSQIAIAGIETKEITESLLQILGINLILGTLSYMLFPYLWRS